MVYHFESSEIWRFNFQNESWDKLNIEVSDDFGCRFCLIGSGESVIIIGGVSTATLNRVLQLRNSTIKRLTPMLSNRADLCAVAVSENIYAIGGYNEESDQALNTVEVYNLNKNKWTSLHQMIYPRVNSAAAVNGLFIYVFGGVGVSAVEKFDIVQEEWSLCELSMPMSISASGITTIAQNQIMIFGGVDESGTLQQGVYLFDLLNESIVMQQQLHKPSSVNKPIYSHNGLLYLFNNKEFTTYFAGRIRERQNSDIKLTPSKIEYVKNEESMRNSLEKGVFLVDRHSAGQFKVSLPVTPNILIVRRIGKDDEIEAVFMRTVSYLLAKSATIFVEADRLKDLNPQVRKFNDSICDKINLVITLGGDGTVIWAISLFKHTSMPPLLAFNMGSLGFMASYSVNNLCEVMDQVFSSTSLNVDLMSRLKCHVKDGVEKT